MSGMVLRPHEVTDGEILASGTYERDIRVPAPLRTRPVDGYLSEEHPPRVAGHSPYLGDACQAGGGRHLFDVIESVVEREVGEPHTDEWIGYEYDFRARLTCVNCGKVLAWEGTRREQERVGRANPVPLVAGNLVAQQISAVDDRGYRDMSTWLVYRRDDGGELVEVGVLGWARGQRGRAYHVARFHDWPQGETVEAADPAAALRKLARGVRPAEQKMTAREVAAR